MSKTDLIMIALGVLVWLVLLQAIRFLLEVVFK